MSDLYSILGQIVVATRSQDPARVVNLFTVLSVELENYGVYMDAVVDNARAFLSGYLAKVQEDSSSSPKEGMN